VDVAQVRENAEADVFLPGAPDPGLTLPTTTYRTRRRFPRNLLPVDYYAVSPQHPHWPLIVMLVLTQLSVGAFAVGLWLERSLAPDVLRAFQPVHALIALVIGLVALAASTLHLGRPQYAFRAVLGLSHSWLSREIVAFGSFAACASAYAVLTWTTPDEPELLATVGWLTVTLGLGGVLCSAMIYVVTGREFWGFGLTLSRFLLSAVVLGTATTQLSLLLGSRLLPAAVPVEAVAPIGAHLTRLLLVGCAAKLALEFSVLRHLADRTNTPLKRSARLMTGPLLNSTLARFAAGLLGGCILPLVLWTAPENAVAATPDLLAVLATLLSFGGCQGACDHDDRTAACDVGAADPSAPAPAGDLRPGTAPGPPGTGGCRGLGLRILLDRLRPQDPHARRAGGESHAGHGVSR
jgi:DMSO reductase anchor subunit